MFYDDIKNARAERQVEDVYNLYLKKSFGVEISNPYASDGFMEFYTKSGNRVMLLIEYKYNLDYKIKTNIVKTLIQCLYYIKRFEVNGRILPNIIMVGDINEVFCIHVNKLIKYLDRDLDWNIAPSDSASKNPDLILEMVDDNDIAPFVYWIDEHFSFKDVVDTIINLADEVKREVHVTEHNISVIFDYFCDRIIKSKKNISSNDIVAIFLGSITDKENYYLHPTKKGYLHTPFGDIQIDETQYNAFIKHFKQDYSPKEKMRFHEISDRLIEDTNRRNKGEFYTPTLFVDYAHKMIEEQLGENWKDEYVVYDNCCGTKNLTRDYRFKELYCSTLENAELELSKKYNTEAVSFQFDFLNDYIPMPDDLDIHETKIPQGLLEAFKQNKKIVFFLNPPYGSNCGLGIGGRNKSKIAEEMNKLNMKSASSVLYGEFLYRILLIKQKYNLTNCIIALFCKPSFMALNNFNVFRKYFLQNFKYIDGCLFNAGYFGDVSAMWGITFNIWKNGEQLDKNNFRHTLINNINGNIEVIGKKNIYNIDGYMSGKYWVENKIKGIKNNNIIGLKAPIKTNEKLVKGIENALGYLYSNGNCCLYNQTFLAFMSAPMYKNVVSIMKNNFNEGCAYFAARSIIKSDWINDKDEYFAPKESHPKFQEFVNDSIIYASLNGFSSLRNVNIDNKRWDIKNEFFWMSKEELQALANEYHNDDCYTDAHTANERFVYKKLQEITLSTEAQAVLDKANELVRKSFKYRQLFNNEHPEYQINNWDCGWYQIKALLKEYLSDDLKEFKELYKALSDKMRPMVYELGFLRK